MDSSILEGNAIFTNALYQILSRNTGNVFFSPFSIHAVLSMVYQGARGDSAEAFSKTLHNPDVKATASGYKSVIGYLNALKQVSLLIANKIYSQKKTIQFNKEFESTVTENFGSEMEFVDFDHPETVKIINDWVAKKTNDKIKKTLEDNALKGHSGMVLINTICFKGDWFFQFSEEDTVTDKFYVDGGKTVDVQMMCNREKTMSYGKNEEIGAEVLEINFAGLSTQMVIILPFENTNIKDVEAKLITRSLTNLIKNLKRTPIVLHLPKFKIEETIQLKEVLKEMGLEIIFDPEEADFAGITSDEKLHVGDVIQKTYIDVNEYGCEASAATVTEMLGCSLRQEEPILFKVNRPCIFMLVASDRARSKNILFYGRLSQPTY